MEKPNARRNHSNLHYIFAADKQAHQLSAKQAEKIRERICKLFSETLKSNRHIGPPNQHKG